MADTEHRNVIIVGSGPAGYTAALYTARANLKPLLIEGLEAGGQLMLTTMVENWPGFREGIMGPDLMAEMRKNIAVIQQAGGFRRFQDAARQATPNGPRTTSPKHCGWRPTLRRPDKAWHRRRRRWDAD